MNNNERSSKHNRSVVQHIAYTEVSFTDKPSFVKGLWIHPFYFTMRVYQEVSPSEFIEMPFIHFIPKYLLVLVINFILLMVSLYMRKAEWCKQEALFNPKARKTEMVLTQTISSISITSLHTHTQTWKHCYLDLFLQSSFLVPALYSFYLKQHLQSNHFRRISYWKLCKEQIHPTSNPTVHHTLVCCFWAVSTEYTWWTRDRQPLPPLSFQMSIHSSRDLGIPPPQ